MAQPDDEPPGRGTTEGIQSVGAAHVPVMCGVVVEWLRPRLGAFVVDATVGAGGHAAALLDAAPDSRLLALDHDPSALTLAADRLARFGSRVTYRQGSFADCSTICKSIGWTGVDAVLVDLGVSSMQLDTAGRGFSFQRPGPLDMRMDPTRDTTAATIVNEWPEAEIERALREFGEEPRARAVARAIVRARPLADTGALAEVVRRVLGPGRPGHHPATRTFQGLRIAVNDELGVLDRFLADTWRLLRPDGRLAILSYHSLEDRRVKTAFRWWSATCHCPPLVPRCVCGWQPVVRVLTPRPVRPDPEETARNPRARSARLRVVERLPEPPA
jgi:16S rRNA (cytosine1402-N4)-methyltransferase